MKIFRAARHRLMQTTAKTQNRPKQHNLKPQRPYRLMISGGGTGGHIFPALAIARAFQQRFPDTEFLFVGAKGRMEMKKVAEAGYRIVGLWISGLQRRLTWSNLLFPVKVAVSYFQAVRLVKKFKPHAVVGTGGYASSPTMMAATRAGIPALIQEQNSYAGLANKQAAARAQRICVAYSGMERYFPSDKIKLTGNPVRRDIVNPVLSRTEALARFGFSDQNKTLLIMGGSLGARTINESVAQHIDKLTDARVQVIWQTGSLYINAVKKWMEKKDARRIWITDFIQPIDEAYAAADVVISRAGALAISELSVAGKPVILVPSPNVAEDHQTKNAVSLVQQQAALLVRDADAKQILLTEALNLLFDEVRCASLSRNIRALARPNATEEIVDELVKLIEQPA
jgi:UDP-N-acetylglucosamine--N-acetylmuramyl-(pentapeptide) pyrophosphoryl-undecaprenol N-acetylglucosamine transferase